MEFLNLFPLFVYENAYHDWILGGRTAHFQPYVEIQVGTSKCVHFQVISISIDRSYKTGQKVVGLILESTQMSRKAAWP